jgi:hypothetical protein
MAHTTEAAGERGVITGMRSLHTDTPFPLALSEQLSAMLAGWLDRHAPDGDHGGVAAGIITVAEADVAEVFCADWQMTVRRNGAVHGPWAVLVVEGRAMPVRGFTEITAMYRA